MAPWQRRARFVVAIFGIAVAVVVYFAMRQRPGPPARPPALERLDPEAQLESFEGVVRHLTGTTENFELVAEQTLTYADGSAKMVNVRITVRNKEGRDFVASAREAQ